MSARAFDDRGCYQSGELFEIAGDALQYYRDVDRSKDLVTRGGVNISSEEIENLLQGRPGVREAAVVGLPNAVLGEKRCACVVAAEGALPTPDSVARHLREERRSAGLKLPEYLLLIPALPRNPLGKILKRDLRVHVRALGS